MEHEILYGQSFSLLRINLSAGEEISAEAGAMVSMSSGIQMETGTKGGLFQTLKRSMFGGETFFINTFKAEQGGEVTFAPPLPGAMFAVDLAGKSMMVQSGSYIASVPGIDIDTKWGGVKTFFSSEGLFMLKVNGAGKVFLSSYGAIHEVELAAGQNYTVDTGHIVAFDENVNYAVRRVGGLKSTFFSGEGLVCDLTGPGKIMLQTRSEQSFLAWLIPQIPTRSQS